MKSPWKLIGQLISGRRSPDAAQARAENDANHSELPANAPLSVEVSPTSVEQLVESPKAEEVVVPEAATRALEPTRVISPDKPRRVKAGRARKTAITGAESKAIEQATRQNARKKRPSGNSGMQSASVSSENQPLLQRQSDSFEAEVMDVDAQVRALSRQLAEKLKQQNAQLCKMLERFGGA